MASDKHPQSKDISEWSPDYSFRGLASYFGVWPLCFVASDKQPHNKDIDNAVCSPRPSFCKSQNIMTIVSNKLETNKARNNKSNQKREYKTGF